MKIELEKDEAVQIMPIEYPREECPIDVIREMMPLAEIMTQLAEEAAELSQAALKYRRTLSNSNPTPVTEKEAIGKVMEEICDLYNALEVLKLDVSMKYDSIRKKKMARWVERIQKGVKVSAR